MAQKTLEEVINDVRENRTNEISLNDFSELTKFPEEIYELENLEQIHFGRIPLTTLSTKILNLSNLKKIVIHSDMPSFPMVLLGMKSLTELILQSQKLRELPNELNSWTQLKYLHIGYCNNLSRLNGLPPNLSYLNISEIGLNEIPKTVFELKSLYKLVAHSLSLRCLPDGLFDMTSLLSLFINSNKLRNIPDDIAKLSRLQELWLDNNEFDEFPMAITKLKNLETLYLRANNLSKLPSKVQNLTCLTELNLGANRFKTIPANLFKMKGLVKISFENIHIYGENQNNCIKTIPNGILKLENLSKLDLYNNPISNVPSEILREGTAAVKNFLESKLEADKEEFLYEAKMVIVGRGNVGKTALTKKLSIANYSLTSTDTTKGIDILKNPFLFPIYGLQDTSSFKFNIWDFGGQEKYDATHQLFITNRSVYIFLTEAREESNYLDFYYWLNTIKLFSSSSPVIVALSKCDERRKLLPESLYREKFKNIVTFVEISCADGYEHTIESLKDAIKDAILLLPQTGQKLSNRWVEVRKELENLALHSDFIDYEHYLSVCSKYKLDKKRADFLSQYLNDLGVIIHRQNDLLLKKTVFINTDWCVDGMYKVLDDESVVNGKFTDSDLSNIWNEKRFETKQPELLKLMHIYNLCFELKDGTGYIAPDLLPPDRPNELKWDTHANLHFEYRYVFMPAGILSRFIVKSHSFIKGDLFWKYGVVLEYEDTLALIEEDYIHSKVTVQIRGENKKGLLAAVRMYIEEVHRDFDKENRLEFQEMIPCNCYQCRNDSNPHFYKFSVLKRFEQNGVHEIRCEESSDIVKIKSLINDIEVRNASSLINSEEDLKDFIVGLIDRTLYKEIALKDGYVNFWRDTSYTTPKNEVEIQPYISNTLDNYCKVQGIHLGREVREANGSVDILFSYTTPEGQLLKVCLEIKKAHHDDVIDAINTQLPAYMNSAETSSGIYLVIWYKNDKFLLPKNWTSEDLLLENILDANMHKRNIDVRVLNCSKPISPSRL